jgi:hypothetical protein
MDEPDKNASDQPLPGSVSNQNQEEAEPGHDGTSGSGTGERDDQGSASGDRRDKGAGESGEGSQSTGNPNSAG